MSTKRASAPLAHVRLRQLQRKIYRSLEREAQWVLGEQPRSIERYEQESDRDFRGRPRPASKKELIEQIRAHDVTLIADFHTFAQAQRTALRLAREAVRPGERWALGIELIPSQYQGALDDFQAGRISTAEFHRKIRYQEHWGFPWKNYEPLFEWARKNRIRCVALNSPGELIERLGLPYRERGKDLHSRDLWAAGIITDRIHAEPGLRMIVLYGGHHVGRAHLPTQLRKVSKAFQGHALSCLSVHQNHADTYWKLARQGKELEAQVLRLRNDAYCVFSSTPWAQLQSAIACAEGEDVELQEDSSSDLEPAQPDYLSMMDAYGAVIADFLGRPRTSFAGLHVTTVEDADLVDRMARHAGLDPGQRRLTQALIAENERFYLSGPRGTSLAYLAAPSHNSSAEFAAVHLLRQSVRLPSFYKGGREDFFRCALQSCFGFLGSLILNPRRKCDLAQDHARRVRQLGRGSRPAFAGERVSRKLVLEILSSKTYERALHALPSRVSASSAPTWIAARALGQILAKQLYPELLRLKHGSSEFNELTALFFRRRDFEEAFAHISEYGKARRKRARAKSKSESI